jgi:hypothetical protein
MLSSDPGIAPPVKDLESFDAVGPEYTFLIAATCAAERHDGCFSALQVKTAGSNLQVRGSPMMPSLRPSSKSHLVTAASCANSASAELNSALPSLSVRTRYFHRKLRPPPVCVNTGAPAITPLKS